MNSNLLIKEIFGIKGKQNSQNWKWLRITSEAKIQKFKNSKI
jgi:hypothetical protein